MVRRKYSPWIWIPSLCIAEEIPSAVVMFVALLMFVQFGADETMAALYSGLLFLPWVMKSYFHSKVRNAGNYKRNLHWVELLMFICLMGIAVYISETKVQDWLLFIFLFVLSFLCAWHELLSRMYYSRMLYPLEQQLYGNTKMVSSQLTLVVTYGILLIVAGGFEVFFRSYQKAWAMESSLVAGGFLVVFVLNFVVLQHPHVFNRHRHESLKDSVKTELHSLARFKQKPHVLTMLISLFVLLLPQALLFNTRVFFLLASSEEGGLSCSVQDVGFAQGTIGVVAFFLGVIIGRAMMKKNGQSAMFWDTAVVLTLSPLSYWLMARNPQPDSLLLICCMTFFAQLCFGFGLNVCRPFIIYISEQRYRNTTNFLYVPLVASLMVVPMTLSGWLCTELGYQTFFLACAAIAPVAWILLVVCKTKSILFNE